jgi:hypothetical protein
MANVIDPSSIHEFISFLKEQGVTISQQKIPAVRLKPRQVVSEQRIERMATAPERILLLPYLVSLDLSLFDADAHLRWKTLSRRNLSCSVSILKANISSARMDELYREYAGS